jgi:hypothetical protein
MPTTPETPAPKDEWTESLADDYAKCHECTHGQGYYKSKTCATCDGTSEFIPYTPSRP